MAELIVSAMAETLTGALGVGIERGPLGLNGLATGSGMFDTGPFQDPDDVEVAPEVGAMGGQTGDAGSLGVGMGAPKWPNAAQQGSTGGAVVPTDGSTPHSARN